MSDTVRPETEDALAAFVAEADSKALPLDIRGGGTKRALGRPTQTGATIDLSGLTGITLYEPSELVIAARAGTPVADVEAALAENGQHLAFEPMDYRHLYGMNGGSSTIGAVAACNISGPRRIMTGAARDSLIGVRLVNGKGEAVKSGGRVMKNVTGYDLVKLMAGAHGTLGILTEVTFKVLPKPEAALTLVYAGLADEKAREAMSEALGSPFEITGAAHLPGDPARTLLRIEGFPQSLDYRAGELTRDLKRFGTPERLETEASETEWQAIRDVVPLAAPTERAVWRISTAPTRGPAVAAAISNRIDAAYYFDWGGGLIWLACAAEGDAGAAIIREALGGKGHATLVRAPDDIRAAVDVFEPQPDALMALTKGVKTTFDPGGILNPGRMYAGV